MNLDTALWALGRGTGIISLALLTAALVLGIVSRSGRPLGKLGRLGSSDLHRTVSMTAVGLIGVHMISLLFDSYAQLRVVDLVVPFLGAYRPLWLGLGTLAVDVLIVVTITALLRHHMTPRAFKAVHLLTYALWPMALAHGVGTGTDTGTLLMNSFAVVCTVAGLAAMTWRLSTSFAGRGRNRIQRKVPAWVTTPS